MSDNKDLVAANVASTLASTALTKVNTATAVVKLVQIVAGKTRTREIIKHNEVQQGYTHLDLKAHSGWMTIRRKKLRLWLTMTIEDHGKDAVSDEDINSFYKSICVFLDEEDPQQTRNWLDIILDSGKGYANLLRIDVAMKPNDPDGLVVAFTKISLHFAMPPNITIVRHGYKNMIQDKKWDEIVFTPHNVTDEEVHRALAMFQNIGISKPPVEFCQAIGYTPQ